MSAIAGIVHTDGHSLDQRNLTRMVDALAHRGSDGSGFWHGDYAGLGHQMLWTTPESLHEHLPLVNQRGDLVLTAVARIDNRAELLSALGLTDRQPDTIGDSEIILAAYDRWGERCPEHLLGDFAFAIWDTRTRTLFCARDHLGVRPFYYYTSARLFAFATEIRALLSLPEVPRRINEAKIADYLLVFHEDRVSTFYADIVRLPPGHCLIVRNGQVRAWSYWTLELLPELRLKSDDEYAEGYRAVFTEAVRCRMRSAFPLGSMLSGGLDSSSITCVARAIAQEQGLQRIHTFSAIFDEVKASDERPFINAVLAQGDLVPNFIHGDQVTPLGHLDHVLWHEEEPFFAPNLFVNWAVWERAKQQGIRVLLDGIMGDSTAAHGFELLGELAYQGRWLHLAREVRAINKLYGQPFGPTLRRYLWQESIKWHVPPPALALWRRLRGRAPVPPQVSPLINADFARRFGLAERVAEIEAEQAQPIRSAREAHYRGLTTGLITSALEAFDRGVAAFGIDARLPFMDRRLVEFSLALPSEQKFRAGWNRSMVRRGLGHMLPDAVRLRLDKGNLSHNFRHGLAMEQARIEHTLQQSAEIMEPYLDIAALKDLYQQFLAQTKKADEGLLVLLLSIILAAWLRDEQAQPPQKEVLFTPTIQPSRHDVRRF